MQRHGAIEISLGGSHSNGDGRHLDDLRGVLSHHVAAEHTASLPLQHKLQQMIR